MKRSWNSHRRTLLRLLGVVAVVAMAGGCAGTAGAPPPPDEKLLAAAGFKVLVAKTPEQEAHLRSLPPGEMRAMQRNGVHYYVYPDAAANRLYVGTQKEYQAYVQLHPQNNVNLQEKLNAQQAADMAAYGKRDAAMQQATQRDLSDPYLWWPSFGEIIW